MHFCVFWYGFRHFLLFVFLFDVVSSIFPIPKHLILYPYWRARNHVEDGLRDLFLHILVDPCTFLCSVMYCYIHIYIYTMCIYTYIHIYIYTLCVYIHIHNCFVFASVSACFQMAVPMGDVAHRFCCSVSNLSNALFAWVSLSVGKEPLCKKGGVDMPRSCFLRNLTF